MQSDRNKKHKEERASIFASFDALKGFREYLKQKERVVVDRKELSIDECEILNWKARQITIGQIVAVIYYNNDEYIKVKGMVSKIDLECKKNITIVDKKIQFDDIISIEFENGEIYE